MSNKLLEVKDLKTYFTITAGEVKAVDGVSFSLDRGESIGLVENRLRQNHHRPFCHQIIARQRVHCRRQHHL